MNSPVRLSLGFAIGLTLASVSTVWAQTSSVAAITINEAWVLTTLKEKSPSLRAAAAELEQASEAKRLEEGKFPYTFQADGNYTRSNTPLWNGQSTQTSQGDTLVLGSQISRVFPTGTTATLRAAGQYSTSQDFSTSALDSSTLSTTGYLAPYQTTLRFTLTQPLLSGYGTLVNQASLRAARISEQKQRKALDRESSELLRDALLGYWEFWYNGKAVDIQVAALELAKVQQHEADLRVVHGQLAAADALKFRTQVATLTESLINAEAAFSTSALELGRLVGITTQDPTWKPGDEEPFLGELPGNATILEKLRTQSPALAEQTEALRLAREKRQTAGDEYRAQLNAQTWVEAAGASGQLSPALHQTGTMNAVGVFAGLTFISTLDEKRLRASRAQAAQAVALAEANLAVTTQQLETTALQTRQKAEQARAILQAATQTQEVATQQAENERQRFTLGASTPLDVQVAEDTLRQARLRVVRAKVDEIKARISLDHAIGELAVGRL
jgi:outer membrane protein